MNSASSPSLCTSLAVLARVRDQPLEALWHAPAGRSRLLRRRVPHVLVGAADDLRDEVGEHGLLDLQLLREPRLLMVRKRAPRRLALVARTNCSASVGRRAVGMFEEAGRAQGSGRAAQNLWVS